MRRTQAETAQLLDSVCVCEFTHSSSILGTQVFIFNQNLKVFSRTLMLHIVASARMNNASSDCEPAVNFAPLSTVLMFNVQSVYFIIHAPPSAKNIQLDY